MSVFLFFNRQSLISPILEITFKAIFVEKNEKEEKEKKNKKKKKKILIFNFICFKSTLMQI